MKIGVIGAGRMGSILVERMMAGNEVLLYDADPAAAKVVAESFRLKAVTALSGLVVDALVLAVPDTAVKSCLDLLLENKVQAVVFNVATNISREMLAKMSGAKLRSLNVKIIGHAGEMSRGARPVIVIDQGPKDWVELARQLFNQVGTVVVGEADQVKQINVIATEEALKAAVAIERTLCAAGIVNGEMIRGALSQVAPGVLKAFAEDDLGPFARGIVDSLRGKANIK